MKIVYSPGAKGKTYIEAEDVFLVCMMHKLGYPITFLKRITFI